MPVLMLFNVRLFVLYGMHHHLIPPSPDPELSAYPTADPPQCLFTSPPPSGPPLRLVLTPPASAAPQPGAVPLQARHHSRAQDAAAQVRRPGGGGQHGHFGGLRNRLRCVPGAADGGVRGRPLTVTPGRHAGRSDGPDGRWRSVSPARSCPKWHPIVSPSDTLNCSLSRRIITYW